MEKLTKTAKNVRIAEVPADIRTQYLPNTSLVHTATITHYVSWTGVYAGISGKSHQSHGWGD
jgi:hypothetical protein